MIKGVTPLPISHVVVGVAAGDLPSDHYVEGIELLLCEVGKGIGAVMVDVVEGGQDQWGGRLQVRDILDAEESLDLIQGDTLFGLSGDRINDANDTLLP
jgi:hypothetical protein